MGEGKRKEGMEDWEWEEWKGVLEWGHKGVCGATGWVKELE